MLQREVVCPYCGKQAKLMLGSEVPCLYLVDGRPVDDTPLQRSFWVCIPCQAYVLTHKRNLRYGLEGTEPLGPLANQALRRKRFNLHQQMDPIWQKLLWSRNKLYKWLADRLGLPQDKCHIAMLSDADCDRAINLLEELSQFAQNNHPARKPPEPKGKKEKKK
jgi:hypothetical protein